MTSSNGSPQKRLSTYRDQHKDDVTKGSGFSLNPLIIKVEKGFNVRDESSGELKTYIESLTKAYMEDKFVPPLIVTMRDGEPTLVDGHCRLQAILNAIERGKEISRVPVIEYHGEGELDRQLMLLKANSGRPLSPTEEAKLYHRLHHSQGFTLEEISERVGKSTLQISSRIELHQLPIKLKAIINEGRISPHLASKLYREYGTEAIGMVKDTIHKMDEAVAEAERTGKAVKKKPKVTEKKITGHLRLSPADNRLVKRTLTELSDIFITDNSRINHVKSKNRVDISFTHKEFMQFADMMQRIRMVMLATQKAESNKTEDAEGLSQIEIDDNVLGEDVQEEIISTMR